MTTLAILTMILLAAFLYWINAEQDDYDRAHYDPRKEKQP